MTALLLTAGWFFVGFILGGIVVGLFAFGFAAKVATKLFRDQLEKNGLEIKDGKVVQMEKAAE